MTMTGEEFREAHNKHLKKIGDTRKEEQPRTWLMAESGWYCLLEGDLEATLERHRQKGLICTVHHDQTSIGMSHIQSEHERVG